jgi:Uma2 family endonuclease
MATTTTPTGLTSWEAFEKLPDGDGYHREILEGEVQTLPPPKSGHSNIASNAYEALLALKNQGLGRVYLEAGYRLSQDPATWIQPDVSFLRAERVSRASQDDYFTGAPNLAVEVVSPSESAADIQRKVKLLLGAGAEAVWVVYPKTRTVEVHRPDGTSVSRHMKDTLSAPFLPPDWESPVAKLFED